jgi:ABC-2 type transport system permease protein
MNKMGLVARREFLTRVQKKTFLLSTILVPLLIVGFYTMIIFVAVDDSDKVSIAVKDEANVFNGKIFSKRNEVSFVFVNDDTASLKRQLKEGHYDAYFVVPKGFDIERRDSLQIVSDKKINLMSRGKVENPINNALEEKRLMHYNISASGLDSLKKENPVSFTTVRGGNETNTKEGLSSVLGFVSGFMIYIILFIYGTMVMRGVMEEKVSRIAEVIVSSVKPFQLMMGKIIGIGAVGLVQFFIWGILFLVLQLILPLIIPGLAEQMQSHAVPMGGGMAQAAPPQSAFADAMHNIGNLNLPLIIGCFIFYFLGGYLLYSSLFAAVGSAVNEDPQDAQSLLLPITMPIVFGMVIMIKAVGNPNSGLAVFGSLFPFTSPIVMMARIAHGVPDGVTWAQLLTSMALLVAGFLFTTWLAAKIYRTGILLYGKKVTWKEMWKWAFRKS